MSGISIEPHSHPINTPVCKQQQQQLQKSEMQRIGPMRPYPNLATKTNPVKVMHPKQCIWQ